ncbi:putative ABC transporter ATP-binding protein [Oceanococcus atlanticus]|uniref:Putative ABC transporter ATP-binding protein n=1 Tax=Oceanococcus atlanticus TaxID=1317117 RepID=A0A1Y1SDK1_9GAMM|nr:ABC transporter ATP-binding protein [Oceanococcus atlanticus]ORE86426.1 putative ABC transporter ATP-binding protein [Oceanococcus atlanticus]
MTRVESVIQVEGLVKSYADFRAIDGISFEVRSGETVGLLGPNGAGKTSTMRVLAGLSPWDEGRVRVCDLDAATQGRNIRQIMGVVTQHDGLDGEVTVRQNLELFAYLSGVSRQRAHARADEVLAFFSLTARADDEVDDLSGGMKRRLAIARALMIEPQVIVLDEPTTGLDPHSRAQVWEKLAQLKSDGVTVLMSTHYMDEAAILCDRIAIMDRGRILALAPPHELIERYAGDDVVEIRLDVKDRQRVRDALTAAGIAWRELGAMFRVLDADPDLSALQNVPGLRIERRSANLEDVFLRLTGKELDND